LKRYEFPFCCLMVPDDWNPIPPLGLEESSIREDDRLSLQVAEQWMDSPIVADDYARKQRDLIAKIYEDFELIREVHPLGGDPRSGAVLIFEYENEERLTSREIRVFRVQGPQACILTLLGPGGPSRSRDQVFDAITRSFEIRGSDFFAKAQQAPLLSGTAEGAPFFSDPSAIREKFPRACVSLHVPQGWDVRRDGNLALLLSRDGRTEIRLRRILENEGSPSVWFAGRMKELRENPGSLVLTWNQGSLPDGRGHAAILSDETARSRSWTTAATPRTLDIMIADRQPFVWTLCSPSSSFQKIQITLQGLIAGVSFLDPSEWETCPPEKWIDVTLRGPWKVEGPGTYSLFDSGNVLLFQLSCVESHSSLETLRPHLLDSLIRAFKVQRNTFEIETLGLFRGLDALRYSGKGRMAVRAIWIRSGENLYSCTLSGSDPRRTDELFLQLVESLRLPGMRDAA
jgi:hypothetical protein